MISFCLHTVTYTSALLLYHQDEALQKKVLDILVEDSVLPSKKRSLEVNGVDEVNLVSAKTPKFQVGITEKM